MERKDPLHFNSSASGKNLIRGSIYADGFYIWNDTTNSWMSYSNFNSITSLTGVFFGDGSGLTGIVASANVDWSNISATGTFKGDGSSLTGIGHNSLTGLLENDHPQYSSTSHIHSYLPLSGGTVSGNLTITGNLIVGSNGGPTNSINFYGPLDMHNNSIQNVSTFDIDQLSVNSIILIDEISADNTFGLDINADEGAVGIKIRTTSNTGMILSGGFINLYAEEKGSNPESGKLNLSATNINFYGINNFYDGNLILENGYKFIGDGSNLFNIGHNSLTGLLENNHPQYTLTSSMINYTLTSSMKDYTLTSNMINYTLTSSMKDYTLTSSMINYTLTSSMINYTLTSNMINYTLTSSMKDYSLTGHIHSYLPLSGGDMGGNVDFRGYNLTGVNNFQSTTLTSTDIYVTNLHGPNTSNFQIRPATYYSVVFDDGAGVKIENQSLSTMNGIQTNLIHTIDIEDDLSITANKNINVNSQTNLSLTGNTGINLYGNTTFNNLSKFTNGLTANTISATNITANENLYVNDAFANNVYTRYPAIDLHIGCIDIGKNVIFDYSNLVLIKNQTLSADNISTTSLTATNITADDLTSIDLHVNTIYTNNINGRVSGDIIIEPVNGRSYLYYALFDRSATASDGIQTNLISPIDTENDSILITTNKNLDIFSDKTMTLSSNGSIDVYSAQNINLYGNTTIYGSLSAQSISGRINSNGGFILENRTSDPTSPSIGQIWFRTDL